MKFMKLGSKPDSFQTDADNMRHVTTELATDIVVNVGEVKFYLHKFPLLSKSARLQKLVAASNENTDEINIQDIPGGPAAFEICAKFCYGMTVTLNAYNVIAARCAAEYLEMHETVEKGNLIYKIEVFLNTSIFRSWKDSIIVLQTTKSLSPWSEELKLVSHCLDSIASKASIETSMVDWSYTYNRKKLQSENGVRKNLTVPTDWWVEDLCELNVALFKRVIATIKTKGNVSGDVIGEALSAYALRKLPGFSKGMIQGSDLVKYRSLIETIVLLLPTENKTVSCSFLLNLLRAAMLLDCGETERNLLTKKIGQQLDEAKVSDLMIRTPTGETTMYDADIMQNLVHEFVAFAQSSRVDPSLGDEYEDGIVSDAAKRMVAKLVDGYLTEISRDPSFSPSKFVDLAEMVSSFGRTSHDGIYRAIDMYLKEHPAISKSEKKRVCKLMDCKKLSPDACMHAVQNERLPLRVIVQVLFFEQLRSATSPGDKTPDIPRPMKALVPGGSHGSSRSTTTNTDEDWDAIPTAEEITALKAGKTKGLVMSKIFSKLLSRSERQGDISSDTSESPGSTVVDEVKSNSSRSMRNSQS